MGPTVNTSTVWETVDDGDDRVSVVVTGPRLDAVEAAHLREVIEELLVAGTTRLVVDLSGTGFVDSAGLACLVRAMTTLRRRGGDVALVRPASDDAWRVFRLTQFDEVFPIIPAFRPEGP
ncbi:MAG: anti-sigma factor antagonist [Actinomycetota bacterium]|nr:anti-sigma factor antagonist [Actinomycetota bacterium]